MDKLRTNLWCMAFVIVRMVKDHIMHDTLLLEWYAWMIHELSDHYRHNKPNSEFTALSLSDVAEWCGKWHVCYRKVVLLGVLKNPAKSGIKWLSTFLTLLSLSPTLPVLKPLSLPQTIPLMSPASMRKCLSVHASFIVVKILSYLRVRPGMSCSLALLLAYCEQALVWSCITLVPILPLTCA